MSQLPFYVYIIAAVIILYGVFYLWYLKRSKERKSKFLQENPTAATITVARGGQRGIKSLSMNLHKIDDALPTNIFDEGIRVVYIIAPGTHVLEVEASTTRPGVMHKTVTEIFGPVKVEVEAEPGKHYKLDFNTKEKQFTFTEKEK